MRRNKRVKDDRMPLSTIKFLGDIILVLGVVKRKHRWLEWRQTESTANAYTAGYKQSTFSKNWVPLCRLLYHGLQSKRLLTKSFRTYQHVDPLKRWIYTGKNNGFPFLDIFGYLKNTHKNPKFGRVRQIPIWELSWEFPGWDLSHFAKFGIFMGIL